jgi:uncharacterized ubiquitin-like protein YukD
MLIKSKTLILSLILFFYYASVSAADHKPVIDKIKYTSDRIIEIQGNGFGNRCSMCEVIARYSDSLWYSVPIKHWNTSKIDIELPDLNQNEEHIQLHVKRSNALSNSKTIKIKRRYAVLSNESRSHTLKVGEKGEDIFSVKGGAVVCGQEAKLFHHAEINFIKRRFSDALIINTPPSGCGRCKPITVRWYNEPTGLLVYELKQIGRVVQGVCKERQRNKS